MEHSRITGEDPDGHQHVVRIVSRRPDSVRVVCDTCGYSKWSVAGARGKAERHLGQEHDADHLRREIPVARWVMTGIGLAVFVVFLLTYGTSR
ncbi:hypothetical protein [Kitasatospora sp. NPDC059327]|uniref:hypothetical protein n=1 Tax=Kitasatospora sp. NPDC059327 TaxID=3346803 RepID=UPI0036A099C6